MAKKQPQLSAADIAAQAQLQEEVEIQKAFETGITTLRDLISPSSIEIHSDYFRLGTKYGRTIYVYGYPRSLYTGWLSSIINIDEVIDISMYIYPVDTGVIMKNLQKKVTQLEASANINSEKGKVRDPELEAAISDAEELRDQLQVGAEKFFRYGLYVTIYADSLDELQFVQHKIETIFGQQMVFSKVASSQQEQGMNSTMPQCTDQLQIRRNMNTGAISTSFPFTSADLTQEKGILYGINMHNNGLVIFDRFSLENANMVVFAKSGAGKSFTVKLEALRSMMVGTEVLIIDPENEYQKLCDAVGGAYIRLSLNSDVRINPFDLPKVVDSEDANDALRSNLVTLHGLFRLMLGSAAGGGAILSPNEEADLDQALIDTYARAGITNDPLTHTSTPPTIINLFDTLLHMGGTGPSLAQRLRKYTTGTFAGIFSQQSNIDINNQISILHIVDPRHMLVADTLDPVSAKAIIQKSRTLKRFTDTELHTRILLLQIITGGHRTGRSGCENRACQDIAVLLHVFKSALDGCTGDIVVPQIVAHLIKLIEDDNIITRLSQFPGLIKNLFDIALAARCRDDFACNRLQPVKTLLAHLSRQDSNRINAEKLGVKSAAAAIVAC